MQLTKRQLEGLRIAIARYKQHQRYTIISGYAGTGKAQPIDTIISTPNGIKKLGELKVGDYVFDRKGKPTKVLGIFPQGKIDCYKVSLKDGRETLCGAEHLWSYYDNNNNLRDITVEKMLKVGIKKNGLYTFKIPNNQAVEYEEKKLSIHPYIMGVFLGDGCCKERYLTISSENEEIPSYIGEIIDATPVRSSLKNYNWTFKWNNKTVHVEWEAGNNSLRQVERTKPKTIEYFEKYSKYIITEAYNKSIPDEYKYSSIEQRFQLIQGLMDTDGSICGNDNHRYNMRFTSTSLQLIKDLQEILQSLGYGSSITEDKRKDKYTKATCYTLSINMANEEKYKFFKLKRKLAIAEEAKNYHKRRDYTKATITNIEKMPEQEEMVCILVDNPEHLYLTNDFIVTHNTTLVKQIISALNLDPRLDVCYVAFTGRASEVLKQAGNPNTMTIHKLLYYPKRQKDGSYTFSMRKDRPCYKLLVVDEISMVTKKLWKDLLKTGSYIIGLGDPFQIPAIGKSADLLEKPHIFLDQIMRQAAESDIIQISMKLREGKKLTPYEGNDIRVYPREALNIGMLNWADQCLCSTNETRRNMNNYIRKEVYHRDKPVDGDKLMCLHNSWKELSLSCFNPLVNGTIGIMRDPHFTNEMYRISRVPTSIPILYFDLEVGEDYFHNVRADVGTILNGEEYLTGDQKYRIGNCKDNPPLPIPFDYSYFITTNKAQGSQWNKVLVLEEGFPYSKINHDKLMYTAITRAISKCTVILK